MSAARTNRAHASPAGDQVHPDLRVLEPDPSAVQRRRTIDDLFVAAMVVLSIVFAVGMMKFIFSPAAKTVSNATTSSSHASGP